MIRVELKISDGSPHHGEDYYFVIIRGMPGDKYIPLGSARLLPSAQRLKAKAEAAMRAFAFGAGADTGDKQPTVWDRIADD